MGLLEGTLNFLDKTTQVLNEAAFGDIRNIFKGSDAYNFRTRPIGIVQKNYDYMLEHLYRNIGNAEYVYDGYYTPIGELANPFYNYITRVPWFYSDSYKNLTSNYLDYMRSVYGATLSVENINENNLFHISEDASAVGYVDGIYAIEALANNTDLIPNVNGTISDTKLGITSGYYNRETLRNAVVANDRRTNSITEQLSGYFGIKTKNIEDNKTYTRKVSPLTGRFVDGAFSSFADFDSPVDVSNYGNVDDLGSYIGYYNSLSYNSKKNYDEQTGLNKYHIRGDRSNSETYFLKNGIFTDLEENVKRKSIRYIFSTLNSNITDSSNGGVYVYTENENGHSTNITYASFNSGTKFSRYTSYNEGLTADDLLKKTNDSFKQGKYDTIVARFHTNGPGDITDTTQTAISDKYALSHGRNLLKTKDRWGDESEGYENPYCRVWTFHHQYHRLADAIRPLQYSAEELYGKYNFSAFTADHSEKGFDNGRIRLEKFGSLNRNNGLVNITPIDTSDSSRKVDIKNCMFSIENLAWKDAFNTDSNSRKTFQAGGLSSEQKGPFGGRIMWFPPYDLKFSEDVNVNWNETNFIGRGEGIYTYTNTTRTGNLSFKILVDHPSIINYWENRGKSYSNKVDDVDDPEQQILRFFAGCDMLTSSPTPTPKTDVIGEDEAVPSPQTDVIKFFVFYPNNYSGVDDSPEDAIKYLVNGLGAGKERRWAKNSNGECYESLETTDYKIPFAKSDNGYGGYEMRPGKPISIVDVQDSENPYYIADVKVGNGIECNDGKTSLYVQEGDETDVWWQRKWYYRVDNAYRNQLLQQASYIDSDSFCLNSKAGQQIVAEKFGVSDTDNLCSLADVFVALEGGAARTILDSTLYDDYKVKKIVDSLNRIDHVECIGKASVQGYKKLNSSLQKDRAETIKNWLSNKKGFNGRNITATTGGTGGKGEGINNGSESDILNKIWRCAEVNIYVKKEESKTAQAAAKESYANVNGNDHQLNSINGNNTGIERVKYFSDLASNRLVEESILKDRARSIRLNRLSDNVNNLALNLKYSSRNGNVNINSIIGAVADFSEHSKHYQYSETGEIVNQFRGKNVVNDIVTILHDNATQDENTSLNNTQEDKSTDAFEYSTINGTTNNEVTRYDNEAKFFSMLEKEEPFLHHKISDKIKYFDPAFHSISPEGFNARLTFLQQCTRQGPTVGASDNNTSDNTANNLSFGRPPVCILRIGDFYYTKILIDSLSINFDPMMWDLNSEGIGVMPMIADINIRFKFIGGSSLAGHISRLQNALSFNYYANTEVYDNRSELAEYDENGNLAKFGTLNLNN